MSVTISIRTVMYIPYQDPGGRLENHEFRHLKDMRQRFTLYCAKLEATPYSSKSDCDRDCRNARTGLRDWIKAAGKKSNDEIHKTHRND